MLTTLSRCDTPAATDWLDHNLADLAHEVRTGVSPEDKAFRVAGALSDRLPDIGILTSDQLAGNPERYQQHILFASADFSVTALVWRPGQQTTIHDHLCWCAVAVLQGIEHEILYRQDASRRQGVTETQHNFSGPGTISHFAPPGDIHRVRNTGDGVAVSLHVYGADISRTATSVLKIYDD